MSASAPPSGAPGAAPASVCSGVADDWSGIYGLSHQPEQAAVVLVPVPWEATVTYGQGTAAGPAAILRASDQVELFDVETGSPSERGIAMVAPGEGIRRASDEARALVEQVIESEPARRLASPDPQLERLRQQIDQHSGWLNDQVRSAVGGWIGRGKLVGLVGGDHSTAFGSIAATAAAHPGLGVLQFDAHADLRRRYQGFEFSHASVMLQVIEQLPGVSKLVSVGLRDLCEEEHRTITERPERVRAFFDADVARRGFEGEPFARMAQQIASELPQEVYVSFDIDGLDPALCPHTGTPVPGGLSLQQATAVLAAVVASGRRILGFDLCEVAPGPPGDEWDGNVGARVLYKLIGYALQSRR